MTFMFQEQLEKMFSQNEIPEGLKKYQIRAWDHFLELGLPSKREEVFRYVKLRNLYSHSFVKAKTTSLTQQDISSRILPECKNSVLVFVNGMFQPQLSQMSALHKNFVVSDLQKAVRTYSAFFQNTWAKSIKTETDPFAGLNLALHEGGVFLYLPPNISMKQPVQILSLIDSQDHPMLILPNVQVIAGRQSELNLVTTTVRLSGEQYFLNSRLECHVEEGAHLELTQTQYDHSEEAWSFEAIRGTLKRDSTLKSITFSNGSSGVRSDYAIRLTGENGNADLSGLWMLNEKREVHTNVLIDHLAPHCSSRQLFKGVLDDRSSSSFEGKIYVHQEAQKTDAFQLNSNLLLSDLANADSKPNLEIFADDVKASHGATVGQIDQESLFYLKSRGYSDAQAKNILVQGFCRELIDLISIESLNANVKELSRQLL